jgi:hypothetical protein
LEKIGLIQNVIIMWDFFSQCGVKRKRDFVNNAETLVSSWIKLLKRTVYAPNKELIDKLDSSAKEFLKRFINKYLKIVDSTEDTFDGISLSKEVGFELTEVKGSNTIFASLAEMSLYCYDITINILYEMVHICASAYKIQSEKKNEMARKLEERLGWLIQFIAFILKAKANSPKGFGTSDQKEIEIYVMILQLMQYTSSLYQQNYFVSLCLEFAYLSFCEGFRREVIGNPKEVTYESDFASSSDTYSVLQAQLHVTSFYQVVDLILQKLYTYSLKHRIVNLQVYTHKPELIQLTLECMKQVIIDSSRIKKLEELQSIETLLKNPSVSFILVAIDNTKPRKE